MAAVSMQLTGQDARVVAGFKHHGPRAITE